MLKEFVNVAYWKAVERNECILTAEKRLISSPFIMKIYY